MLKVRRFVLGVDEPDWLSVWNVVYGARWDLAPMTIEEMRNLEESPEKGICF